MAAKPPDIHPAALEELRSAVSWYLDQNETAAIKFIAEIDRAIELVTGSPGRWPAGEHGTRKFVLQRFPYAIIYRGRESSVQILAGAHGHRRPGYWKNRV
jgi:plasmid stabilization system protein ParE